MSQPGKQSDEDQSFQNSNSEKTNMKNKTHPQQRKVVSPIELPVKEQPNSGGSIDEEQLLNSGGKIDEEQIQTTNSGGSIDDEQQISSNMRSGEEVVSSDGRHSCRFCDKK